MNILILETVPQAYYQQGRELVQKHRIRNEQILSGFIFLNFGKKKLLNWFFLKNRQIFNADESGLQMNTRLSSDNPAVGYLHG
jgi:hypothetical protein